MVRVKGGFTTYKNSLKRNSIEEAEKSIRQYKKGEITKKGLLRALPMECFYERDVLLEIRFDTEAEAKAVENDYKKRFTGIVEATQDFNGHSEIRDITPEELDAYVAELREKYPQRNWKYGDYTFYLQRIVERETPLLTELLSDPNNLRYEYIK